MLNQVSYRVEADEITYNLHIMLRYELEKKIFNDNLSVDDIPNTWNKMFKEWFGIEVPEDRLGCLQDIHWSMAAFGYFPTYTLGNLYAAQILSRNGRRIRRRRQNRQSGNWQPMLDWLRSKNPSTRVASSLPVNLFKMQGATTTAVY